MSKFVDWMNRNFLDWQMATGERQSLKNFARYLGIKYTTLSSWMNSDSIPSGDNIHLLADKLGDEIYEILQIDPPERRVREVRAAYGSLETSEQRDELQRRIHRIIQEYLEEHGYKRVK